MADTLNLRALALIGARLELDRILTEFPELRDSAGPAVNVTRFPAAPRCVICGQPFTPGRAGPRQVTCGKARCLKTRKLQRDRAYHASPAYQRKLRGRQSRQAANPAAPVALLRVVDATGRQRGLQLPDRTCEHCGKPYHPIRKDQRFCTRKPCQRQVSRARGQRHRAQQKGAAA